MKTLISILSALSLSFSAAFAIPAKPGLINATQPDGTSINIYLSGDEFANSALSTDGYLLITDSEGFYVFADTDYQGNIIPTKIKEINPDNRSSLTNEKIALLDKVEILKTYEAKQKRVKGPGLMSTGFNAEGEQRALVILAAFQDRDFTIKNPNEFFTRMLNEPGFSDYGATGSVRDYFMISSSERFLPQFDVYGPVTLPEEMKFYGANNNNMNGSDSRPYQMMIDACMALDDEIDFSIYDTDGDGTVDNVYIFYAGYGEADGGGANTIWPHSANATAYGLRVNLDGVLLNHYACSNELQARNNNPVGIGTFCHEFSHVLGLPDLYSTYYTSAFTPGSWDLLDSGSYNNNSRTPPAFSSYERYALGWIDPLKIEEGYFELGPLIESNQAILIPTRKKNEYLLLENRQKIGFDSTIPSQGMLLWHIDFNAQIWNSNIVNNDPDHQYVDIIEADNIQSSNTIAGDPFPGSKNVTELSYVTIPALKSWDGQQLRFRIFDITETKDGNITFNAEFFDPAGVERTKEDLPFRIAGNTLIADGETVKIYDLKGLLVGILSSGQMNLPSGRYIAVTPFSAVKFHIP